MNSKNKIYQPHFECMDQEKRQTLQLEKLQNIATYCYENVPFYRKKLSSVGITSGKDIKNLKDIEKLPFTTKEDLRSQYPFGLLAVDRSKIIRAHASSGTTGTPTLNFYTKKDLEIWTDNCVRTLLCAGVSKYDTVQIAFKYGLFTGGFSFHQAAEKIGCMVIPASAGNTEKQIKLLKDLRVTTLIATSSYVAYLSEIIRKYKDKGEKFALKRVIFGSERCGKNVRKYIENNLNIKTYENYGMTEFLGAGVAFECPFKKGMHISDDIFYPEIIDPHEGKTIADEKFGELVLTSLEREAMPLLRYKTRDITKIEHKVCECKRTSTKMVAPKARVDDMFIFKGVNIFPSQIEILLNKFKELSPHYKLTLTRDNNFRDRATLEVETNEQNISKKDLFLIKRKLEYFLRESLLVHIDVVLKGPYTLERFSGKAKRIYDFRFSEE